MLQHHPLGEGFKIPGRFFKVEMVGTLRAVSVELASCPHGFPELTLARRFRRHPSPVETWCTVGTLQFDFDSYSRRRSCMARAQVSALQAVYLVVSPRAESKQENV